MIVERSAPNSPGLLGAAIAWAGRFRPTERLAMKALVAGRAGRILPKFVRGKVNGKSLVLDLDEMIDAKIFVRGAFDPRGLGLMCRIMKALNCRTALDIGANIGNHSAFFSDWARIVYAFEPNPPVFARLQAMVTSNGITNVIPMNCGLSSDSGELTFYVHPGQAHLATLEKRDGSTEAGQVLVRVGDQVVSKLGIRDIDFVKIDVEGHEYEALHGLRQTLARERPVLVMEFEAVSIRKFGTIEGLQSVLPHYRFFGTTRRSLSSRLLKSGLSVEPFIFGKSYSHALCMPQEKVGQLAGAL